MAPPKSSSSRKPSKDNKSKAASTPRRHAQGQNQQQKKPNATGTDTQNEDGNSIDISATIPITLQQLLLNVFRAALLPSVSSSTGSSESQDQERNAEEEEPLDIKSSIQTIKSHLYNRDFDSAFTGADDKLLRAYALRWSAARALGYAGLFKSMLKVLVEDAGSGGSGGEGSMSLDTAHVVCIGGGAGAEIVALAAAWRDLVDEGVLATGTQELADAVGSVSLNGKPNQNAEPKSDIEGPAGEVQQPGTSSPSLYITAVDIADWSSVVKRLSSTIPSPSVQSLKSHPAPLLTSSSKFAVDFERLDVLSLSDQDLTSLFHTTTTTTKPTTNIVTLMFTLNELFSTSLPKTTSFLLRTTDTLQRGTILLVVDSPGSYSTLKLNKAEGTQQERQYPMKFLLDHTLLSVAKGKWEKLYSQDSRWWRRDSARLWYDVGEGAGLEDMRFQIHVYRRT